MGAGDEQPGESAPLKKLAMRRATAERLLSDFQTKIQNAPEPDMRKTEPEKYFPEDHPLHPSRIHSSRTKINEILTSLRAQSREDVSSLQLAEESET